jgi:NADH-quinone oxidoreductase subunit C
MSQKILDALKTKFTDKILETHNQHGDETAVIEPSAILEIVRFLRDEPTLSMKMLMDATAVDWNRDEPRFELVYHFYSIEHRHRVRIKARVGTFEEEPKIDSLTSLYLGANWLEREAFDLYGIKFVGHPDLKRIYTYEGFEGHPLRKDYPINKRQPLVGPKS